VFEDFIVIVKKLQAKQANANRKVEIAFGDFVVIVMKL